MSKILEHNDYLLKPHFDFKALNVTATEKLILICNRLCSLLVIGCYYRFVRVICADLNANRCRPKGSCSSEICLNILRVHDIRFCEKRISLQLTI